MHSPTAARIRAGRRAKTLKQFYFDTVNFNPSAMRLALEFAGEDHLLAGSDYPHQIGSIPLMLQSIERFDVDDRVKQRFGSERGAAPRSVSACNEPANRTTGGGLCSHSVSPTVPAFSWTESTIAAVVSSE